MIKTNKAAITRVGKSIFFIKDLVDGSGLRVLKKKSDTQEVNKEISFFQGAKKRYIRMVKIGYVSVGLGELTPIEIKQTESMKSKIRSDKS